MQKIILLLFVHCFAQKPYHFTIKSILNWLWLDFDVYNMLYSQKKTCNLAVLGTKMLRLIKDEIDNGNIHKDKIEFIEIAAQVEKKSFFLSKYHILWGENFSPTVNKCQKKCQYSKRWNVQLKNS